MQHNALGVYLLLRKPACWMDNKGTPDQPCGSCTALVRSCTNEQTYACYLT